TGGRATGGRGEGMGRRGGRGRRRRLSRGPGRGGPVGRAGAVRASVAATTGGTAQGEGGDGGRQPPGTHAGDGSRGLGKCSYQASRISSVMASSATEHATGGAPPRPPGRAW